MNKSLLVKIAQKLGPAKRALESLAEVEAIVARKWADQAHKHLYMVQWGIPPQPEFFDHSIDLYHLWSSRRASFWLERGIFGSLALGGGRVLELACGDGFNARHFYSSRSESVVACDFDPKAIATAKRKNYASNIEYRLADIRKELPEGKYQTVVWDAAIEHFTQTEMALIFTKINESLLPNGILTGHTIVEKADGSKSLDHHEYEFKGKDDLLEILKPHFNNVFVFETLHPNRHNLYFWASEGPLPFGAQWTRGTSAHSKT